MGPEVLVVVGRERVQEERHPIAARRSRLRGHVDGVRLEDALVLTRAARATVRRRREATDGEISALRDLEVAHQEAVNGAGLRHAAGLVGHVVADSGGELREVDVGVERAQVARGERRTLVLVAPPGRAGGGARRVAGIGHRLVVAEGDVEESGRADRRPRAAGVGRIRRGLGQQVTAVRLVPQAHASGQANHPAGRIPSGVRHAHLDLPPGGVDRDEGSRAADRKPRDGVDKVPHHAGPNGVNGEEQVGRCEDVRPGGEAPQQARGAADGDRAGDQRRVLQRVQRHPERGRVGQRLHAELDEVGRVVRVRRIRGIGVRAVRLREQVPAGARIRRVRYLGRAVVVVQEVLVEKLPAAVGAGPGDEDRRGGPDAHVLELRGDGGGRVQDVRPRAWTGAAVERTLPRLRGRGDPERAQQQDRRATSAHAVSSSGRLQRNEVAGV